jgi:penicillin amidase
MKLSTKEVALKNRSNESSTIKRQASGITEVNSKTLNATSYAQGYTHCIDRFVQLFLLRIIAKGRISELLDSNEETNGIDKFMRQINFYGSSALEVNEMSKESKEFFQSYCDGINDYLSKYGKVWEFKLLKVDLEPWTIEDSLTIIKIMSYIGLAQTQQDAEKFIIQQLRNDCSIDHLKQLFTPHLDGLSDEVISDLKNLEYFEGLIPEEIKFMKEIPKFIASNNWVVAGQKTTSGNVIQCNDPHLEINRLPAIWYEQSLKNDKGNFHGMTMPGIPGIIMGRSDKVSFGFTYGFMDMIDYFIEDVKDNQFDRDGSLQNFIIREEVIKRKKDTELTHYFFENDCGTLEAQSDNESLRSGKYLNMAWSCRNSGASNSAEALYELFHCSDVHDLKKTLQKITISCNWLFGDTKGNIGYQQSGQFPHRKESGLYPLRANDSQNLWKGIRPKEDLTSVLNPDCGFLATANNDLSKYRKEGDPVSINLPMGPYRVDRIEQLLLTKEKFSIDELKKMQSDLYSNQAEYFLKDVAPFYTNDPVSECLKSWNFNYDKDSKGSMIFEDYYFQLISDVFGPYFGGTDAWAYIEKKSSLLIDFYYFFDQVLLGDNDQIWFKNKPKEEFIQSAFEKTKERFKNHRPTLKEKKSTPMKNILFDGKLPAFLGFDYGPLVIEGSRATIVQGALYESHGRVSTFCPSMRFVCDLGENYSYSVIAGGVSDRRFSKLYTNEMDNWLNFEYKKIKLD